jgi:DNA modification methylase
MTHFPIKDLKRAEYNPRIMPDAEMQALMKSIESKGFIEPIVINIAKERYGTIVGGHQRLTAVEKLLAKGIEIKGLHRKGPQEVGWDIPCFTVEFNLEDEKQANIALNRIGGKFDEDKLYNMIVEMKDSPTLPTTGMREDEISRILDRNMPEAEDDDKLVLEGDPISKPGEIYELGEHRLICGDATDPETYTKLLGSVRPDMIWTDPPYNVDYKSHGGGLKKEGKGSLMNDNMDPMAFKEFIDKAFTHMLRVAKTGAAFYVCSGWQSYPQFLSSALKSGLYHSGMIIWVKPGGTISYADYKAKHEWIAKGKKADNKTAESIMYGWKDGVHTFYGDNEYDVWEMPRKATSNYLHPTEKPDWLAMRAIRNSTKRGDIVLDPFAGSGSVMSACDKTGRRAFMIELDPKFCDVIRKRYDRIVAARQKENE